MRVGMIGLGKLGLPVATAMASRGLEVYGYDVKWSGIDVAKDAEALFAETWERGRDSFNLCDSVDEVVANAEVIFVAVQTPHEKRFEGVTPLPDDRADFDYSYLKEAVHSIFAAADRQSRKVTVAVISTVLPGTMQREIWFPAIEAHVDLVYNPSFIAMGTTIRDFLDPEFVLLGGDKDRLVDEVYGAIHGFQTIQGVQPVFHTSIANAELIKVAYNTFIGLKIAFANTLMEVCHKTPGTDVGSVTAALMMAHKRLISPAYLEGGMGDGGGCHPRDNIALSWLARELDLSYDLFGATMQAREAQAEWLADLMLKEQCDPINRYPSGGHRLKPGLGILGIAYKPESHLTTGSPALLVAHILKAKGAPALELDPYVYNGDDKKLLDPRVWLIGCKHPEFADYDFPPGSVVIDPFRYIPDQEGVRVIPVGA